MKFIKSKADYRHLIAGGIAASLTASICCIGPLVLLTTGISGAWMSKLMVFEPYQPFLILVTLVSFAVAASRIFFVPDQARENDRCENACYQRRGLDWKRTCTFAASFGLALVFVTSEYWIQLLA